MIDIIIGLVVLFILYLIFRPRQLKDIDTGEQIFFDHIPFSTDDFYTSVEEGIENREIPSINVGRILLEEGGFTSAKRQYLRVARRGETFDICAAPFGTGFFVSWRLGGNKRKINRTYYQIDTHGMYKSSIKAAINEAIDKMGSEAKGIRENAERLYRLNN